jgi:hypothetical protein
MPEPMITWKALAAGPAIGALLLCSIAHADTAVPVAIASGLQTDSGKSPSRLRFRPSGPTCMCGNGLSEIDIENAAGKRRTAARSSAPQSGGPDTSSTHVEHSSQGGSDEHQGSNPKGSQP